MSPPKYILTPPDELHPLVEDNNFKGSALYPDFEPWKHTKKDDEIMLNFVAKGYYSTPKVNLESISARSSIPESLPKISDQLANQFSDIINIRETKINNISAESETSNADTRFSTLSGPGFSLPNRVTLSDRRKEHWLKELSSPYVSLVQISKFFPHGLKRRRLLEQCCLRKIPIIKAIWLLKCCYSMEWKQLSSKNNENKDVTSQLLKEWTENFIYILEKLLLEISQHYNDPEKLKVWKTEIQYFLKLLGNCYQLEVIDKQIFLFWLVEFVGKVDNLEYLPMTLHILTIFWKDITKVEDNLLNQPLFLISKISDTLLSKYALISQSKSMISDEKYIINDIKKNNKIKETLLMMIRNFICDLFQNQLLEIFLFPAAKWDIYKPFLYEITSHLGNSPGVRNEVKKKLELVSYRNESLKINNTLRSMNKSKDNESLDDKTIDIHYVALNCIDINLSHHLDDSNIDFDWASYVDREISHSTQVIQMLLWAFSPSKKNHYEAHQLVAKIILLIINSIESLREYVIEDIVWSVVFQISKCSEIERNSLVSLPHLYRLLNMLINYGIIKVPTYIRKLISSGILYIPSSDNKFFHCTVLINLKISPLMKNQYNMVLRNIMEYDSDFYKNYNFDNMIQQAEKLKPELISTETFQSEIYTYSVKTMLSEWYLSSICGEELVVIDKKVILNNFNILCIKLDTYHLFYKWVEFIVYHQLIADIESLEVLTDILLRYCKLFAQFINDHILFTKTLIMIYAKVLKSKDNVAYSVSTLMPFWKFFMKSFPYAIKYDEELRIELGSVYEEEKAKVEKLRKDRTLLISINEALHGNIGNFTGSGWNFVEVFQTNLRTFLNHNVEQVTKKNARYMLLLLMYANNREYNKFIAVFLKKKTFEIEDLILLVSYKLLTFEQIQNTFSMDFALSVLSHQTTENARYADFIHSYQGAKDLYIKANFKSILEPCMERINDFYILFVELLVKYGTHSKLIDSTIEIINLFLKDEKCSQFDLITDLLNYGVNDKDDDDTQEIITNDSNNLFELLDFTNLWVFQAYSKFLLEKYLLEENDYEKTRKFLFETIVASRYSCLCSELFKKITDPQITRTIITIFEAEFFKNCLTDDEEFSVLLEVSIEVITSICGQINDSNNKSMHQDIGTPHSKIITINNVASPGPNVHMEPLETINSSVIPGNLFSFSTYIESLNDIVVHFSLMDEKSLSKFCSKLDAFLRISILHQSSISQYVITLIKEEKLDYLNNLLEHLFILFNKISFDLSLKLMLYEILSSLKSYCIYYATTENGKIKNTSNTNIKINLPLNLQQQNQPLSKSNVTIPPILMNIPPFKVSSFIEEQDVEEINDKITLGINTVKNDPEKTRSNFFFYSKSKKAYSCKFYEEPYHRINNYQTDTISKSFNNSCLNLCLFDAVYEKKNPK